jgi:hypothetical protein
MYIFTSIKNAANEPDAGILKFLGQELKHHPELRFPTSQQCIDQVRKGSSVYIFVRTTPNKKRFQHQLHI